MAPTPPPTPPDLRRFLAAVAQGGTLDEAGAEAAFGLMLDGQAGSVQIAGLLMGLRARGETVAELAGGLRALRARMRVVDAPQGAIDVCGTGGDGRNTLNISTAVALVAAGCGAVVAKHGNRAASSASGAADVLAALGVPADLSPAQQADRLRETGAAFLFAPAHHPGLRHVAEARSALGVRTVFNLLGPLANPAGVRRHLVGVFDPGWADKMAQALARTGAEHAWVVCGGGLDELTPDGESTVVEWKDGDLHRFVVRPEDAGLLRSPVAAIVGGDPAHNAAALRALLAGQPGAYRDTVLLNAAAALIVAGRAADLRDGAAQAARAIDSGAAAAVLAAQQTRPVPETKPVDA